ncbi:flagellar biosynthesis anti-sigma factor FlgM [Marinospirillum alkaliphilum]|uniref:Negative regulator of flagellin synthesis n=1 Tax=Marinospirillum alkaliphilum DSM 21637 TaxID=1122209 RepID=A0A1K1ZGC6_9GAMM|nr:flagellar biosynthesis anti-sigma factor FlgM [Marinospirillum alkaliphilum]SFX73209.1 anti-sigma-28 factor, FlgM family [Marinospirillum alkaliphilum DSM 21637]
MAIELNGISSNPGLRVKGSDQSASRSSGGAQGAEAAPPGADRVQLSAEAQHLLKSDEEASFDSARVEALKKQIADGSYQVDYRKLAANLMNLESRL